MRVALKKSILKRNIKYKQQEKYICIKSIINNLCGSSKAVVRTLCKVFPSPGSARSVWALPQTSCNMVADTDHPTNSVNRDNDGNLCANEADIVEQSHKTIFEVVKSG